MIIARCVIRTLPPKGNPMPTIQIQSKQELEFILFCVDFISQKLNQSPDVIYDKLKSSGLLQDYLIDNYEVLHSLSKEYLVDDIIAIMTEKGLL